MPLKVGAMMLTADRPKYEERAVRCFFRQTYLNSSLFILDSGQVSYKLYGLTPEQSKRVALMRLQRKSSDTIGGLRNVAAAAMVNCDVIIHWDDDDYSGPDRIQDMMAMLQGNGAPQCVGYSHAIFADRRVIPAQAWWFRSTEPNYCIGGSMAYHRSAWLNRKFPETSQGEDTEWARPLHRVASSGSYDWVADIHGGNTSNAYDPKLMAAAEEWQRCPENDWMVGQLGVL